MGRGGIGGAAAMETADSTRAFVKDVRRVIIKVCIHTYIHLLLFLPFFFCHRLVSWGMPPMLFGPIAPIARLSDFYSPEC